MSRINYEIIEKIAVLSERGAWTKELNKVSWNNRDPKFDLRDWNHEEDRVGKGVTLTEEEARELLKGLEESL
ncbi:MAG TPA: PC4/YdbC family ssDNA-binding protein [Tissierellaceae bacterium]|nr:PC4/YdbC family ssDNA-binding protein [Tissierellaceae bacterium]